MERGSGGELDNEAAGALASSTAALDGGGGAAWRTCGVRGRRAACERSAPGRGRLREKSMWTSGCVGISTRGVLQNNPCDIFSVTEGVPFNQFNLDDLNGLEMAP
jgi:hypothetical protein